MSIKNTVKSIMFFKDAPTESRMAETLAITARVCARMSRSNVPSGCSTTLQKHRMAEDGGNKCVSGEGGK